MSIKEILNINSLVKFDNLVASIFLIVGILMLSIFLFWKYIEYERWQDCYQERMGQQISKWKLLVHKSKRLECVTQQSKDS